MKCKECESEGKRSTVHPGMQYSTLMGTPAGHFDEDGVWQQPPDPNFTITHYTCSNGHKWKSESRE